MTHRPDHVTLLRWVSMSSRILHWPGYHVTSYQGLWKINQIGEWWRKRRRGQTLQPCPGLDQPCMNSRCIICFYTSRLWKLTVRNCIPYAWWEQWMAFQDAIILIQHHFFFLRLIKQKWVLKVLARLYNIFNVPCGVILKASGKVQCLFLLVNV